jgi:zinc protease
MLKPVCVSAAVVLLLANASANLAAQKIVVKEHTTPNGMKVLVNEDPAIPNVALYTFFRVGSRNEHEGITGISHFFEHMMFNGAKKYGHGDFDRTLELAGGSNNAYTNNDTTVYQDWFPAAALETVFDLEADRVENLAFEPAIIKSEREVVYSERRLRTDNSNPGALIEQLDAAAYTAAPYHWPVVGWPTDIEAWTMDDLKSYHAMGYSPSNATMVVVGAVKAEEVFRLADKYMGPIPVHDPPPPVRTKEPVQNGERRVYLDRMAQAPLLFAAYHTVDAQSPDYYALQLVDNLLTTGQSSRLYRAVVDAQLATSVGSSQAAKIDPGLFTLSAQVRKGVPVEKVEQVIYAELAKLEADGPSAEELQKAKNQFIASYYRSLQSIAERAQEIGVEQVIFGDYHNLAQVEPRINAVTAADIQRVLKLYFQPTNRTVAVLVPTAAQAAKGAAK